jgi:hypothetical protein
MSVRRQLDIGCSIHLGLRPCDPQSDWERCGTGDQMEKLSA